MEEDRPVLHEGPIMGIDHLPFSGLGDELVYGRKADGSLVHISQAERGLKCECVCPACGEVLSAKKGDVRIHHFSHHEGGCGGGPETNAHIWAKEVLEREKWLLVPAVTAQFGMHVEELYPARIYRFASVKLEQRLGSIIPDVILETKSGAQLIVEVKVTHGCEPAKLETLHLRSLSAIEIDLGRYQWSDDREAVETALLKGARRSWLENARQAEFNEALRLQIEEQEREARRRIEHEKRLAAERKMESERQALVRKEEDYQKMVRSALLRRPLSEKQQSFVERVFGEFEGLEPLRTQAVGFPQGDALWQAWILHGYLSTAAIERSYEAEQFSAQEILDVLRRQMVMSPGFEMTEEFEERYRREHPNRVLPIDGISLFMRHLARLGFLASCAREGFFSVSPEHRRTEMAKIRKARSFESRKEKLKTEAVGLLSLARRMHAGSFSWPDFRADQWFDRARTGCGLSLPEICKGKPECFEEVLLSLTKVRAMISGGAIAEDLIGLPFEELAVELAQVKRDKALAASRERMGALKTAAIRTLNEDAENWLLEPSDFDPKISRSELAGRDGIGYQRARAELAKEEARRIAKLTAENGER